MIVLGIETSCDETGIALVDDTGQILGEALYSQMELHKKYGGVVPELAARKHTETLDFVLDDLLEKSGIDLGSIDAVAVTYGPGLPGALLVGIAFAKGLALALNKPLVPVNHLEAHLESVRLQYGDEVKYPAVGLIVSGGHTSLLYIEKPGVYRLIGKTRDDAAGEAFDKVAKLLDLEYPGGPVIDNLYCQGDSQRFKFSKPKFSDGSSDFSFSGLKTAVLRIVKETPHDEQDENFIVDLAASFQRTAIDILINSLEEAVNTNNPRSVVITGGVAANSLLRDESSCLASKKGISVFIPDTRFCTDNGAMTAFLGCRLFKEGVTSAFDLDASPNLRLGETAPRKSMRYKA